MWNEKPRTEVWKSSPQFVVLVNSQTVCTALLSCFITLWEYFQAEFCHHETNMWRVFWIKIYLFIFQNVVIVQFYLKKWSRQMFLYVILYVIHPLTFLHQCKNVYENVYKSIDDWFIWLLRLYIYSAFGCKVYFLSSPCHLCGVWASVQVGSSAAFLLK